MAVAFGQLRYPVALPVTRAREAKGLAAGFGRQLVGEKKVEDFIHLFMIFTFKGFTSWTIIYKC